MRRLQMMVLDKVTSHNKSVNIKKLNYNEWNSKLQEESTELQDALKTKNKAKISEEVLDVMQVCLGIIAKLVREGLLIDIAMHKHNKKLVNRGCKESAIINISVTGRN